MTGIHSLKLTHYLVKFCFTLEIEYQFFRSTKHLDFRTICPFLLNRQQPIIKRCLYAHKHNNLLCLTPYHGHLKYNFSYKSNSIPNIYFVESTCYTGTINVTLIITSTMLKMHVACCATRAYRTERILE